MAIKKVLQVVDKETGEMVPITEASPIQISLFLTDVNYKRKQIQKVEDSIKKWIKDNNKFEFNDEGYALFGEHKVKRSFRNTFDEETMLAREDKKFVKKYLEVKDKYIKVSEIISI